MRSKLNKGLWLGLLVIFLYAGFTFYGYDLLQRDNPLAPLKVSSQAEKVEQKNQRTIANATFNARKIVSADTQTYAQARMAAASAIADNSVGKLVIPEAQIDLPVLAGINDTNLLNGATMFSREQVMGQGNYILMAHQILNTDTLLYRIRQLKRNDPMFLTDGVNLYEYQTTANEVVEMHHVDFLNPPTDQQRPRLTIFRCEGPMGTVYRRVVQGELTKTTPLKALDEAKRKKIGVTFTTHQPLQQKVTGWNSTKQVAISNVRFFLTHVWQFFSGFLIVIAALLLFILNRKGKE